MQAIPTGSRFVADVQRHTRSRQPLDQLPDRIVLVGDRADETYLASAFPIGNRDRDGFLMNVQTNVFHCLRHDSSPLLTNPSSASQIRASKAPAVMGSKA